jgi:hypothetical protein
VLVLAVQNHAGSTAVTGRHRLRPPVRMAGPPQATSRPSETTSGRARASRCSPTTPSPPTSLLRPASASSGDPSPVKSRPGTACNNLTQSRGVTAMS